MRPPYGVGELARATGLAPGYVSRLIDALDAEALIERVPRGPIESIDVQGLLRRWARSYDVFQANRAETFVAPNGIDAVLDTLADLPPGGPRIAFTGSIAAVRLAPVTAPAMLLAYCERPASLAQELGLLPASEGVDVALLEPFDPVVWWNPSHDAGLRFVAPSQVAVDCLTGNGRMPAEGEAVLAWMDENEQSWRRPSLPAPEEVGG